MPPPRATRWEVEPYLRLTTSMRSVPFFPQIQLMSPIPHLHPTPVLQSPGSLKMPCFFLSQDLCTCCFLYPKVLSHPSYLLHHLILQSCALKHHFLRGVVSDPQIRTGWYLVFPVLHTFPSENESQFVIMHILIAVSKLHRDLNCFDHCCVPLSKIVPNTQEIFVERMRWHLSLSLNSRAPRGPRVLCLQIIVCLRTSTTAGTKQVLSSDVNKEGRKA